MNGFWEVVPVIVIFGVFGFIVKITMDYKTRKNLIDKGVVDEKIKYLYFDRVGGAIGPSLKWGLVLVGVGAAQIIGQFLPYSDYYRGEPFNPFSFGLMLTFAGAALIIYYAVAGKAAKKSSEHNNER